MKNTRRTTVTAGDVVNALRVLTTIKDPPEIKSVFAIARLLNVLRAEAKSIEVSKSVILEKYAEKDTSGNIKSDGGKAVFPDDEARKKADAEWDELLAQEIEIAIPRVSADDFDGTGVGVNEMVILLPFLV